MMKLSRLCEWPSVTARQAKRHVVYGLMGFLFKNRGDYEEAAEWFRAVIDAKPDDADGHIWLGGRSREEG